MVIHFFNGIFVVECTFNEKDTVKACGFRWHTAAGCAYRSNGCRACKVGLDREWWTDHTENAMRLASVDGVFVDAKAKKRIDSAVKMPKPSTVDGAFAMLLRPASDDALKKIYHAMAFDCHPDRGGSAEDMLAVNTAWSAIKKARGF